MTDPGDFGPERPVSLDPVLVRMRAAWHMVAAAALLLVATVLFWRVPLAFALASVALLLAVAAFFPERLGRGIAGGPAGRRGRPPLPPILPATLEALPSPAFLLDPGGIVRAANGRAASSFPATRPGDLFTATFRAPELAEAFHSAAPEARAAVEYQEPGDVRSFWRLHMAPFSSAGESYVLIVCEDIAEKLAIARMRADFVANASHELRTPLASLTGFVETLLGPARDDQAATAKFLGIMLEEARRMRRLIDDLLVLSRAEMRVHSRPTAEVELVALVRRTVAAMAATAREHGVELALVAGDLPIHVLGDGEELVEVLQNLLENAIRYGASGKRVDVCIERPSAQPAMVAVHVRDFGPGIAAEHIPRLTERFYRVDGGASRQLKGTGLGLAIVKHILSRHEGRLDIASRPGKGSTFTMVLPLEKKRS